MALVETTAPVRESFEQHLSEIGRIELLTAADEQRLGGRVQAAVSVWEWALEEQRPLYDDEEQVFYDGVEAHEEFVKANLRLVVSIAKRMRRSMATEQHIPPIHDMVGMGNKGLMRAVDKFDPRKGFKFSTYATSWIRQAIDKEIPYHAAIRIPGGEKQNIDAVSKYEQEYPDDDDLSRIIGHSKERIADLRRTRERFRSVQSLDAPVNDTEPDILHGDSVADTVDIADSAEWSAYGEVMLGRVMTVASAILTPEDLEIYMEDLDENMVESDAKNDMPDAGIISNPRGEQSRRQKDARSVRQQKQSVIRKRVRNALFHPVTGLAAEFNPEKYGWQEKGQCVGLEYKTFFPGRGKSLALAREACSQCVIVERCKQFADERKFNSGVWAGTSSRQRE